MKIVVDGLMTEYMSLGSGPKTILFLHGWGANLGSFQPIVEALSAKYKIIAVNFPGFSGTGQPSEVWRVGDYAAWTRHFLDKLKIKNLYVIVGHSFGGRVILKGCTGGQLSADKLIFIDAAGVKSNKKPSQTFRSVASKTLKPVFDTKIMSGVKRKLIGQLGSSDYQAASGIMREVFKKVIDEDLSDLTRKIDSPSLLIWGENDQETPLSDLKIFQQIPKNEAHVIQNAGHFPFIDQPQEVIKIIKDFLS